MKIILSDVVKPCRGPAKRDVCPVNNVNRAHVIKKRRTLGFAPTIFYFCDIYQCLSAFICGFILLLCLTRFDGVYPDALHGIFHFL